MRRSAQARLNNMSARFVGKSRALKVIFGVIVALLCLILLCGIALLGISEYVRLSQTKDVFKTADEVSDREEIDCIVVLGAGLQSDGTPSHMLEDRIKVGVNVLNATGAKYILMSGDKSGDYYDEPSAMRKYAEEMGVESSKILVDNSGFSTFESITRLKDEFGFDNVVVITQEYHLYRALYIADDCGIDAVGVSADLRTYRNQFMRDLREILARVKDFFMCI